LTDPSLEEMKNLIDKIQENNIKIAFKEPQFNE
jgi:ABC-type Zn uptake system ZnuABC Zn-binding protein ZnuA